jgi:hypothetical protein
MRDLKRFHQFSIPEQEGMLPFERAILLQMIGAENLKDRDVPDQGWKAYADEIGATKKTEYTDKFTVLEYEGQRRSPLVG